MMLIFNTTLVFRGMAEKGYSLDEEDDEWMSSKVTGFKFEDDDETPFQDLAKYQSQTLAANSIGGKEENELGNTVCLF